MCCRWVPHALSQGNKESRVQICNELLVKFASNNFLPRLITVDETWIIWRNEGTYKQTKCWAGGDTPITKNVSRSLTRDKSMTVFFWDSRGVVLWKLPEQGQTMTSNVYCDLLDELKYLIQSERRRLLDSHGHGIQILQDNLRPLRSCISKFRIHCAM